MSYALKASEVVTMARQYKNWQEKRKLGTLEQMWDFHWCAGDKNYTIWAILYKTYTGANYQAQPWCAMYGTCMMVLALKKRNPNLSDAEAAAITRQMFGGDMPFNCQTFVSNHSKDHRLSNKPVPGAHVIFWTGAKYGHWGIVTKVDNNGRGYTSVEGNTSGGADKVDPDGGAVVEKWHSLDSRTRFYLPDYEPEGTAVETVPEIVYKILSTGNKGLKVTGALNIRSTPGTGTVIGSYKARDIIRPTEKTFVGNVPWYKTDKGWCSARFCEGWVLEECNEWWYVHHGYTNTVRNWEEIDGKWYYMDDTGYIATSAWVPGKDKGLYYYVGKDGDMITNKWIKSIDSEKWYRVDAEGKWFENDGKYTTTVRPADTDIVI